MTKHIERHLSAIDAIRLTKIGVTSLHCHAQFQLSDFPVSYPLAYCDRDGQILLYENDAVLNKSDYRKIRELWLERMNTGSEDYFPRRSRSNAIDTAFARFFRSYNYQNWFDSIVDLTIALESLFNPDESQELKHRISLRAAWLLDVSEPTDEETSTKNKTYNVVRTMYNIRSSRVHGGRPEEQKIRKWVSTLSGAEYDDAKEGQLLELAMESARDIVRRAIAACARLSRLGGDGPRWPFPEGFDENVVTAGQRKIWQKAAEVRR